MDTLERLAAIEEIKVLKAHYFRAIDTKDLPLMRTVFADDAFVDFRGAATDPASNTNHISDATAEPLCGGQIVAETIVRNAQDLTSVHAGATAEIEVTSPTTATGLWPMSDILRFKNNPKARGMDGWGHYHETYVKEGGAWKIKTMRLSRILMDFHAR